MGTTVSIDVVAKDARAARAAINIAKGEIQYLGREWYPWENNGELVRLNRALALGQESTVSPALARLLARAVEFYQRSGGTFDPAVGRLVELWGFHRGERSAAQPWPTDEQLKAWQANRPTFADVVIEDLSVISRRRDVLLDLGAIGKGYAVDGAIALLQQHGFENALVNAGGNLRAVGFAKTEPYQRPWRVAIRNPRDAGPMAWLELNGDESISTSGDYERFGLHGDQRFNHIIDPRTGRSATHTMAVTVVAADATLADASSTAVFVAGPNEWRTVARNMGIDEVMRVDADGTVAVSRKLAARLHSAGNESRQSQWKEVEL